MTDLSAQQPVQTAATAAPVPEAAAPAVPTGAYEALKAEAQGTERTFQVRESTFRIVPELPGIVLLDLGVAADPAATPAEQLRAVREFLRAVVIPEDQAAFDRLLLTANPIIPIEELNKIVEGLIEVVGGRPTE